jgi:hypothetical protein
MDRSGWDEVNIIWTVLIVAATVVGVVAARLYWRPLKWPAYAFAAWLCVLLMAWPLSAAGHVWKNIRVGWYITFAILTGVLILIFYGFVLNLLLRAARAVARRLR